MKLRLFAIGLCTVGLAVILAGAPIGHGGASGHVYSEGQGHGEGPFYRRSPYALFQASRRMGGKRKVRPSERHFSDARNYAALYEGSDPVAHFFNERLRLVHECLASAKGGKVLDVGCGPGVLLNSLAGGRFELFGVDRSPEMIREAKELAAAQTLNLAVGRLEQLPAPDNFFDAVLALGVLEYLPRLDAGLIEIARVARPGAVIVVSMLNPRSLYRLWERYVQTPLVALPSLLPGGRAEPRPALRLYRPKPLIRMMEECRLEIIDVFYFDVNICVRPFDTKFPNRAATLNSWLERHSGNRLGPLTHSGFLLKARKKLA